MKKDFVLFHWSPIERRGSIQRLGLVPGRLSPDKLWRPPFVCFADTPSKAWSLSAMIHRDIPSWDLWQTWANTIVPYEWLKLPGMSEVRVYHRIYKSEIWYVGTRSIDDKP